MIFRKKPDITEPTFPFNKSLAHDLAILAKEAYNDSNDIQFEGNDYPKIEPYINNIDTDTQGYMVKIEITFDENTQKALVIAFRGTEDKTKDKFTDATFFSSGYTYQLGITGFIKRLILATRVHTGFLKAYRSVRDTVRANLSEALSDVDVVLITGHSLGGALATLCAVDVKNLVGDKKLILYTYGSPRVGNTQFAYYFDNKLENYWRIVHEGDIVTQSPPKLNFLKHWLSYYHITKSVTIREDKSIITNIEYEKTDPVKYDEFADFINQFLLNQGDGWEKHSLDRYIHLLN